MNPFLLEAAVGLFVAAIVATFGYSSGKRAVQRKIDDAATACFRNLDDLIDRAAKEGKSKALTNAREIVGQCQAIREPLDGLRKQLNSDIDILARLISPPQHSQDLDQVFATLTSLRASWPGKRQSIESETRRLLALLGIE